MNYLILLFTIIYFSDGYIQSLSNPKFCLKRENNLMIVKKCPLNFGIVFNENRQIEFKGECLCSLLDFDKDCCLNTPNKITNVFKIKNNDNCLSIEKQNKTLFWDVCNNENIQRWFTFNSDMNYFVDEMELDNVNETNYIDTDETDESAFDLELAEYKLYLNWTRLNTNILEEEYTRCSVEVKGELFPYAGCRYKGSGGSLRFCLEYGTDNLSSRCNKLSLRVDPNYFNKKKGKNKIMGQKKLLFHSMAVDHSLFAEKTSYTLLNKIDVPASKTVYTKVYINDTYFGIYLLVQNIDDEFTEYHFKNDKNKGKGALYKDAMLTGFTVDYYDKKHREGKKEHAFMLEVASQLRLVTTQKQSINIINKYFDVEILGKILAFNFMIGSEDTWQARHNFYWYVREDNDNNKKLVMIPWDYDRINDLQFALENELPPRIDFVKWYTALPKSFLNSGSVRMIDSRCVNYKYLLPIVCDDFTQILIDVNMIDYVNVIIDELRKTYVNIPYIINMWNEWSSLIVADLLVDFDRWLNGRKSLIDYLVENVNQKIGV